MTQLPIHMQRKDDHVGLANQQHHHQSHPDFRQTRFVHHPLSQTDLNQVSLKTHLAGLDLDWPIFINAMTGGSPQTHSLNQRLVLLAKETGLAMATGSMSIALRHPESQEGFRELRKLHPNGILMANMGAHHSLEDAQRICDLIQADALQVHLNVAQELIMPEGDREFSGLLDNLASLVSGLGLPIIVKEVGFGFSRQAAKALKEIGVTTIDVAGSGGTNFATIENARRQRPFHQDFLDWGQSALASLLECRGLGLELVGSGGVKTPLDAAKCLALGAKAVGLSGTILAMIRQKDSLPSAIEAIQDWQEELKAISCLLNVKKLEDFSKTDLVLSPDLMTWCQARGLAYQDLGQRSLGLK